MIIKCEKCQAPYSIDDRLLKKEGAKFRCSKCQHIFKIYAPASSAEAPQEAAEAPMEERAPQRQAPPPVRAPEYEKKEETVFYAGDEGGDDTITEVDFSEEVFGPVVDTTIQYVDLGAIGEGGMGEVRLAKDSRLLRKVAIKSLKEEAASPAALSYFLREAQITAQLDHPNIVPLYTVKQPEQSERNVSFVMKLIKGRTLADIIGKARQKYTENPKAELPQELSLRARLEYFLKACDGMIYSHRKQVVHRDLKPSNVMVGDYSEVYVMDWGIAKRLQDDPKTLMGIQQVASHRQDSTEERTGAIVGTPTYMSPEQSKGLPDVGPASDQFSLGAMLYELVTLKPARSGDARSKMEWAKGGYLNEISHLTPDRKIPQELKAIIEKSTEVDPYDRYPSVAAMAEDVRAFLRGDEVSVLKDTLTKKLWRLMNKHRELTLIIILSIILIGVGAIAWMQVKKNEAMREAHIRESKLTRLLSQVSAQAHVIDSQFLRLEDLMSNLANNAIYLIEKAPNNDEKLYFLDDFNDPERAPPDHADSLLYQKKVSIEYPVVKLAPGVQEGDILAIMKRLAPLRHHYKQTLLESRTDPAPLSGEEGLRLLMVEGVPISWIYIGMEAGVMYSYPGKGTYPPEYDPRLRPWYKLGAHKQGVHWGNPYVDLQGLGMVLPCATSLFGENQRFYGVLGADITYSTIIQKDLKREGAVGVVESFLLDDKGRVVVSSRQLDMDLKKGFTNSAMELKPFSVKEVVQAVQKGESGLLEVKKGDDLRIIVFHRMRSLNWYYVEELDSAQVLK